MPLHDYQAHVTKYERTNKLYNEIFKVTDIEIGKAGGSINQNEAELFIDTAVQALDIYERDLGIEKNTMSLSQRREQILMRFMLIFERVTKESIEAMAGFYTDARVHMYETARAGVYEILFEDGVIPYDNQAFQKLLNKMMPAFLAWVIAGKSHNKTYTAATSRGGIEMKIYPKSI